MIDHIRGTVHRIGVSHIVIDVGGVGIRVESTPSTTAHLTGGEMREVPTSLVIREDSWTLYGFADTDERDVFDLVQTVSGVGPRTAQALIATLTPDGLRRAVLAEDVTAVMRVPGIGRKGAQRILLELADRVGAPAPAVGVPVGTTDDGEWRTAVVSGLGSLGWSAREAQAAADAVAGMVPDLCDSSGRPDVAALLRAALRELKRS